MMRNFVHAVRRFWGLLRGKTFHARRQKLDRPQAQLRHVAQEHARLQRQARILRTANQIIEAMHGEGDLTAALHEVSVVLVEVGGYAAARLEVLGDLDGRQVNGTMGHGEPVPGVPSVQLPLAVRGRAAGSITCPPCSPTP